MYGIETYQYVFFNERRHVVLRLIAYGLDYANTTWAINHNLGNQLKFRFVISPFSNNYDYLIYVVKRILI